MNNPIFPDSFIFGTSTSAYQIETAFNHDWQGTRSEDGHIFQDTTGHETRLDEDVTIISSLAPHYRMSLMWSKLQRSRYAPFDVDTTRHYHQLFNLLAERGVKVMLVVHHFVNPLWFSEKGGWENRENIPVFLDFARKLVDEFGKYASFWNTFNEPNLYATMAFAGGKFPPFKKNFLVARNVIRNMGTAHEELYQYIKLKFPDAPVGISHNCAVFDGVNIPGKLTARLADSWYMNYLPKHFPSTDFTGLSYYARITFDPLPVTFRYTPDKIERYNKQHDDVWEYYPEGLRQCIRRYWDKWGKPIIITENGTCTNDDTIRIGALKDYIKIIHDLIREGIDIRGYYHWSTWDNFEWTLGPTFRFGLYHCDPETKERTPKPSAAVFSRLAYRKEIEF